MKDGTVVTAGAELLGVGLEPLGSDELMSIAGGAGIIMTGCLVAAGGAAIAIAGVVVGVLVYAYVHGE